MPLPGKLATLLLLLLSAVPSLSVAETDEPTTIVYQQLPSNYNIHDDYYFKLLQLALEKTRASHGGFVLKPAPFYMLQGRAVSSLAANRYLDVLWTMTTREREQKLLPIRIPLARGLLGFRVLLIRKADQARFAALQQLDDLAALRAIQGHDWPDANILRANGLAVTTSSHAPTMPSLLKLGRVDYFPLGAQEAWRELALLHDPTLAVSDDILLHYTAPIYFFVNRDNPRLAARIEAGLRRALADGSYLDLFQHHPATREALQHLAQGHWRMFELNNPLLPAATPLNDTALWYRPAGLAVASPAPTR